MSGPAQQAAQAANWEPEQGSDGPLYGQQGIARWVAADPAPEPRVVADATRAESLWLLRVTGPVLINLVWGTCSSQRLTGLEAPARFTVPGNVQVSLAPKAAAPLAAEVIGQVSLTAVGGATDAVNLRAFQTSPGAGTPIPDAAQYFFALTACALTINGVAVAVAALTRVPLVSGSTHDAGSGYLEFLP